MYSQSWADKDCSSLLQKVATYGRKKFYNIAPGGNLIKTLFVIYEWAKKVRVVDPCLIFQPSQMFARKT
jgi:hypothetical protein